MTSNLRNSSGTDFDSLFATGAGTQLFGIYANNGVDVGQRYLPASSGTAAASCSFLDSSGSDIGPKLCKIGTQYTHVVTVGRETSGSDTFTGYEQSNYGAISPSAFNGFTILGCAHLAYSDGSSNFSLFLIGQATYSYIYLKRVSSGLTLSLPYTYYYSSQNWTSYVSHSSSISSFFTSADVGSNVSIIISV